MAKKRRQRIRSRDFAARYGVNNRRLEQSPAQIKPRVHYVCEFMFGGDIFEMAGALGVCYRQFYIFMRGTRQLSVRLAAQIVLRLNVRAEWLLTGIGPMFAPAIEASSDLVLPKALRSAFPLFDPVDTGSGLPSLPPLGADGVELPEELPVAYVTAAQALFKANAHSLPTALFLGFDNPTLWESSAALLFKERYLHFLAATLSAAKRDLRAVLSAADIDLNHLARLAAQAGLGYGEAVGQWAFGPQAADARAASVLAAAYDAGVPVTLKAEIGEIYDHDQPGYAGAELGAVIGAAAYADHLVFAKYFDAFWQKTGGLVVVAGEAHRWLPAVRKLADIHPAEFTLVLLNATPAPFSADETASLGATVVDIVETQPVFFSQLLRACRVVYAAGGSEGSSGK